MTHSPSDDDAAAASEADAAASEADALREADASGDGRAAGETDGGGDGPPPDLAAAPDETLSEADSPEADSAEPGAVEPEPDAVEPDAAEPDAAAPVAEEPSGDAAGEHAEPAAAAADGDTDETATPPGAGEPGEPVAADDAAAQDEAVPAEGADSAEEPSLAEEPVSAEEADDPASAEEPAPADEAEAVPAEGADSAEEPASADEPAPAEDTDEPAEEPAPADGADAEGDAATGEAAEVEDAGEDDAEEQAEEDARARYAATMAERIGATAWTAEHDTVRLIVDRNRWVEAVTAVGEELPFFSWLSAIDWSREVEVGEPAADVDQLEERYEVLCHMSSVTSADNVVLVTTLPKDDPALDSLVPVFGGAEWHEREAAEMFGIDFRGHPNLTHLYLPDAFEGHPLRKSFALLSRRVKPWPGTVDVEGLPPTDNGSPADDAPSTENVEAARQSGAEETDADGSDPQPEGGDA